MWGADDGGGGFINDPTSNEPQQLTNTVSVGGEEKSKAIAAVSISQVSKLTRPNEGLLLHNRPIYHVNLVAMVHEIIDISSQKIHLYLDDYTGGGPLEVSHIIGDSGAPDSDGAFSELQENHPGFRDSDESKPLAAINVGDYVRCFGVIKFNQDRPNLVAYNLRVVDDPNEVTMHTLEVIRDSMYYQKAQAGNIGSDFGIREEKSVNVGQRSKPPMDDFGNLSTREMHILRFMKSKAKDDKGLSVSEICENFKAFSKKDVADSLDILSAEGQIWQGDGEDIWCVNK